MKAKEILHEAAKFGEEAIIVHAKLLDIHARALAAHCECMALNAEDCAAIVIGTTPPYKKLDYAKVLEKWKIIDEEGGQLI